MRERKNYLILMSVILVAAIGAVLIAVPGSPLYKKPTLGLDLRGGLEVILRAVPDRGQTINPAQMSTARDIMISRIDKLGVASPNVAQQGDRDIVIQLPGVHDPAKAAATVGSTGKLQIFDFEKDLAPPTITGSNPGNPTPFPTLYSLLSDPTVVAEAKKGTPEKYYLFGTKDKVTHPVVNGKKTTKTVHNPLLAPPASTLKELFAGFPGKKQPADSKLLAVPANREVVSQGGGTTNFTGSTIVPKTLSPDGNYWYLFKYYPNASGGPPEISGDDLNESAIQASIDPNSGQPQVALGFNGKGGKAFTQITQAEYQRGQLAAGLNGDSGNTDPQVIQRNAQHNAIVLDGKLQATPYIDYTDSRLSEGIVGGQATINDMGTMGAANKLALVLQSGSLPYTFQRLSESDVSATLGKSSLHQAILAAIAGLLIVALFLLVLYRFLGLVAVAGLAIYGLLYYAAILMFNVTLTLPGFAGLILTIGVAADANVVVFERIKEEVRSGKSVRSAISAGYGKGFHTILDANVVTVITAMVIFLIAVADVKGFALMLLIGTVISLITAVAATRAMLGLLSGFKWFDNPRFMGAEGQQTAKWLQIDFMKHRYTWFGISGAIILAGIIALSVGGLNLGIDFTGGSVISFKTQQPYSQTKLSNFMAAQGYPDAVPQGVGKAVNGDYTEWQIRSKLPLRDSAKFEAAAKAQLGASGGGIQSISGTFGHQIAVDAIWGIIVSLLLITVYITIRFDLKFAMPVILAMLHDIAITIGVYALVGKEVSVATVAAVLTVLGYSIYDTIIIFDRIRENIPLMRRSPFATIANVSLWETIRRSLATTFITLLPIICLYILGGATLKDFAFALIVGVTSGAYSSIFIAAPLLTIWKEREPEYARRKEAAAAESDTAALLASEQALAAEPTPELADAVVATPSTPAEQDRREKRSQRRRSRPHGRTR
ncbi:MAG TPA: protein translocase subunit SecD [Gaiellaceae bacterium]|jgi:SecD/SecF fusion protein